MDEEDPAASNVRVNPSPIELQCVGSVKPVDKLASVRLPPLRGEKTAMALKDTPNCAPMGGVVNHDEKLFLWGRPCGPLLYDEHGILAKKIFELIQSDQERSAEVKFDVVDLVPMFPPEKERGQLAKSLIDKGYLKELRMIEFGKPEDVQKAYEDFQKLRTRFQEEVVQGNSKEQLLSRAEEIRKEALAGQKHFRKDGGDKVLLSTGADYAAISRTEEKRYQDDFVKGDSKFLHKDLGFFWTGETIAKRQDGKWVTIEHLEPRRGLFSPASLEAESPWTGERITHVKPWEGPRPGKTKRRKRGIPNKVRFEEGQ